MIDWMMMMMMMMMIGGSILTLVMVSLACLFSF